MSNFDLAINSNDNRICFYVLINSREIVSKQSKFKILTDIDNASAHIK